MQPGLPGACFQGAQVLEQDLGGWLCEGFLLLPSASSLLSTGLQFIWLREKQKNTDDLKGQSFDSLLTRHS